jgi:capsular exopolysaccharide synthesis family protein
MQTFIGVNNPIAYMKRNLDASVGKKDDIISLSFNSPHPAEAAQIVNAVVDSYVTYNAARKRSTSAEVLRILRNEKEKRGKDQIEKLTAMMNFKKENIGLAFEGEKGNIVIGRLDRLSEALTEAQLATIEGKSAYESAKDMLGDPAKLRRYIEAHRTTGTYVVTDTEEAALKSTLNQLQLRREYYLSQVKSDHPAVKALESKIANVEEQINDLNEQSLQAQFAAAEQDLAVAEQQYLAAREKESEIAKHYEKQRSVVLDLNEQVAQYTILQSDWEQTKKLCDILDDRIKELNVTEDVGALNISILEVACPASSPSEPQKATYMAIALVMGLVLGGGIASVRDWTDQSLRSAEEVSAVFGVPILGVVPSMPSRQSAVARGQKVYKESNSCVAEAYRMIRTAVFFGVPKDQAKTVLITSPTAVDGKTTLVSNLAIAMAQTGQKILILEADFRKPMQREIFEVDHHDVGLSTTLVGTTTSAEAIQPTGVEGLELLPCGPDVPNPSEMLNSDRFAQLLEILSDRYDRVIIDSPPIMPVADARILAAICDITLLVLRAEKSTRKISQLTRDGLLSVGARVLGAVVNDAPEKGFYGRYDNNGQKNKKVGAGKSAGVCERVQSLFKHKQ